MKWFRRAHIHEHNLVEQAVTVTGLLRAVHEDPAEAESYRCMFSKYYLESGFMIVMSSLLHQENPASDSFMDALRSRFCGGNYFEKRILRQVELARCDQFYAIHEVRSRMSVAELSAFLAFMNLLVEQASVHWSHDEEDFLALVQKAAIGQLFRDAQ